MQTRRPKLEIFQLEHAVYQQLLWLLLCEHPSSARARTLPHLNQLQGLQSPLCLVLKNTVCVMPNHRHEQFSVSGT